MRSNTRVYSKFRFEQYVILYTHRFYKTIFYLSIETQNRHESKKRKKISVLLRTAKKRVIRWNFKKKKLCFRVDETKFRIVDMEEKTKKILRLLLDVY